MSKKQELELDLSLLADKIVEYGYEKAERITKQSRKVFDDFVKAIKNSKITGFYMGNFFEEFFAIEFDEKDIFKVYSTGFIEHHTPNKVYSTEITFMNKTFYPLRKETRKLYKFLSKLYHIMRKNLKLKEE